MYTFIRGGKCTDYSINTDNGCFSIGTMDFIITKHDCHNITEKIVELTWSYHPREDIMVSIVTRFFWLNVVLFWLIQFNYILFPFRSRSAQRGVQLTATKQSYFKPLPLDDNILDLVYEPREVLNVVITVISVQR
jgi:hypothetical protein